MELFSAYASVTIVGVQSFSTVIYLAKHFIWIEETGELINEFEIRYIINPILHVKKTLKNKW